MLENTRL